MADLKELQKQLDDIREELQTLLPGSRAYQRLSEEQALLEAQLTGSGAVAQGNGATSVGEDGIGVGGNVDGTLIKGEQNQVFRNSTLILAGEGAQILVGEHSTEQAGKLNAQATTSFAPTVTSILTFLFTDIEGSTQLWEQQPEAMQRALARHDAILRAAIESHKGKVFKTVGDAFYAAFPNVRNALKAALTAQQALHTEDWGETVIKVRMGLHTGTVEARDNDYFGPPLNRVARLISAGHGGQVLLSSATAELIRPNLPENVDLRDMGERRLKDLTRLEHIYQLVIPGLPADFPPLKTLETTRINLPAQLTSFVGREKEISAVKNLMKNNRLTTLTGSGGAGKTRLSLQVATDLLDSFPDGIWFIELARLSDPALIPQTVASTLGLREEGSRPLLEMLTDYLHPKTVLLILDNCEHVIEAAAQFVQSLSKNCPNLQLLVTSREALGIAGEAAYRVPSLSIPNPRRLLAIESLVQFEAARLFIVRARAALPTFIVTDENIPAVAQICSRLDGIPLAIELAAACVKMLRVEQIAERLDDRFRLLTGGSRNVLPRQQTLRALIDWSYDLLSESERALLLRLSIFPGSWALEAAESVCAGNQVNGSDVLVLMAQLVNKSLIVVEQEHEYETRYRLLETIRQYAREKLFEGGDDGEKIRDQHFAYFLNLAERAEPELTGPQQVAWLNRLEVELDNIHAALEWSLERDARAGLRLASALRWFWDARYLSDGRAWLAQLLAQPYASARTTLRAKALGVESILSAWLGDFSRTHALAEESLTLSRELGDRQGMAFSIALLAVASFGQGRNALARSLVEESVVLYRELGDKLGLAQVLGWQGVVTDNRDFAQARLYFEESLALLRELGHVAGISETLNFLAPKAIKQGEYVLARSLLEEGLKINRPLGKGRMVETLMWLGELAFRQGDYERAHAYLEESLALARETGEINVSNRSLVRLGYVALRQGDAARARMLFEKSHRQLKEAARKIMLVYALEGLASLAVMQGKPERAVRIFAWADATRETVDDLRPHLEQADVDRDLATIHTQLDEAAFAAAQAAGRAMTMDEAIAYALESTHPSINSGQDD